MSASLSSSPANPAMIHRAIGGLTFTLDGEGLAIVGLEGSLPGSPLFFDPDAALALSDFIRSPGVRSLIARAWLAEQFEAAGATPDSSEDRRHKRHAGLAA